MRGKNTAVNKLGRYPPQEAGTSPNHPLPPRNLRRLDLCFLSHLL